MRDAPEGSMRLEVLVRELIGEAKETPMSFEEAAHDVTLQDGCQALVDGILAWRHEQGS